MQSLDLYVTDCSQKGFADQEIRAGLVRSGWDGNSIEGAMLPASSPRAPILSPTEKPEAFQKPKRNFRWVIPTVGGLVATIAIASSTIAVAEHGYLPAVSRVYRQTPLPLLWHGTNADSDITIGSMLLAAGQNPDAETANSFKLTVKKASGYAKLNLTNVPLLAALIVPKQPQQYASIANGRSGTSQPSLTPDSLLPATIVLTSDSSSDTSGDIKLTLGIDLGDLAAKLAPITSQYSTAVIPQKTTVDGLLIRDSKKAFLQSNLIPYLTPADATKWLSFDLPDEYLHQADTYQKSPQALNGPELKPYRELLRKTLKDDGIVRKDSEALAKYEVTADPASLRLLAADPQLKDLADGLKSAADQNSALHLTLWIESQTRRLRFAEATTTIAPKELGFELASSWNLEIKYKPAKKITAPATDQIISQPGSEYLQQVSEQLYNNTSGASGKLTEAEISGSKIVAQNSRRKSDLTEISRALKLYSNDDANAGLYPSTNGKVEYLDNPASTLAKLGYDKFAFKLPISDPLSDKYHYTYLSNGKTFRLTCAQAAAGDKNVAAKTFVVTEKSSSTVDGMQ